MAETEGSRPSRRTVLKRAAGTVAAAGLTGFVLWPSGARTERPHDRTTVRYWHRWTAEWKDVVDTIVADFNDSQSRYWVQALSVPWGVADSKFLLGTIGGDPPDLMTHAQVAVATWGGRGLLFPLNQLMTAQEERDYYATAYPVAQKCGVFQGQIFAINTGLDAFALYYLPEQFEESGLDPDDFPETLEDLLVASESLHRRDTRGHLRRLGYVPNNFRNVSELFGGGLWDWDREALTVQSEPNLQALRLIVEKRQQLGFDAIARFNSSLDTASAAGGWPFIVGALSCTYDGQWRVEQIRKFAPDLNYRTVPLPPPVGGVPLAGVGGGPLMVIPDSAREKEGAWEFMKFWSGLEQPERAAEFYTRGGWLPLNPQVANTPIYQAYLRDNPQFRTFVTMMESPHLVANPPVPYQEFVLDQANRAEDFAIRGTWTAEEALRRLERNIDIEVERRRNLGYDF